MSTPIPLGGGVFIEAMTDGHWCTECQRHSGVALTFLRPDGVTRRFACEECGGDDVEEA